MKIGIDARMYGKEQTGIGLYIKNLIENIEELEKGSGNEYVIFLRKEHFYNVYFSAKNFKKVLADSKWYSFSEQIIFLFQILKENLNVMHFTSFNAPILYFKKRITTIHDLTPRYFPGHKMGSIFRRVPFALVFWRSIYGSQKIIAVSNYTRNEILKYYNVSPEKIKVVYQGIPNKKGIKAKISKEAFLEKYKLSKPYIFYTGIWRNHKNIVGLIRAFNILKNEYKKDILLVLGGKEDSFYPEVRREWESLGLEKDIIRPGFIKDDEIGLFLENAQCFVLPSFIEGFGFGPLEALSFGTPAVVSDIPATREALGDAALYFDPKNPKDIADKINLIFGDERLRNELVSKGIDVANKYNWEDCAKETLHLYEFLRSKIRN